MGWVKLDDAFGEHPKIARISDTALALWVTGLAYCNRNLTDGFIPNTVGLGQLRYCEGNATPGIRELEGVGLWQPVKGGWQVHDYADFQPSREAVLAERDAARARMQRRRSGESSGDVRANVPEMFWRSSPTPVPVPVPQDQPLATGKPSRPRKRDELFEALAEVEHTDITALTRSARGKLNDATKQLREIGATPEDVRGRAAAYRRQHPTWDLTAPALVKHWPNLNGAAPTERIAEGRAVEDMSDEELEELMRRS